MGVDTDLADNGGPTRTHALQAGSPAINAGNAALCPTTDQRGFGRQGACDIGPFEFGGVAPAALRAAVAAPVRSMSSPRRPAGATLTPPTVDGQGAATGVRPTELR